MGKDKRKPREEVSKEDIDFLLPVDITKLGSDEDPCFGKLHDLSASECLECGDSDFCALAKAQNLHTVRFNIEQNQRFKDTEESDLEMVKKRTEAAKLIGKYRKKGLKRIKTILKVSHELNMTKDNVKQIYDLN